VPRNWPKPLARRNRKSKNFISRHFRESANLENVKVEGEQLDRQAISFSAKGNREGTDWTAEFSGTISGDEIDGMVKISFNGQTYDLPWKPKRVKTVDGE
jgi:hypothetical protein